MMEDAMKLVWPSLEYLPSYVAALERGWSPDNVRGQIAAQEELARIAADANVFLASLVDREAAGDPITLAGRDEGASRSPGIGDGCGTANFVAASCFAGSAGRRRCLRTVWAISAMQWCRGNDAAATPLVRWARFCERPRRKAFVMSKSPRSQTTWRHSESSRRMAVCFIEEFITPPSRGGHRELRYRVYIDGSA